MAIQLGQFKPLEHKHYTLAKTQSEYDEDAKRQMALDNNRFANQATMANMEQKNTNNRLNAKMTQERDNRALDQENLLTQEDRQAGLDAANEQQRAFTNDLATKQLGLSQASADASSQRANRQLGLSEQKAAMEQEAYNQAQQERQNRLNLAKFSGFLASSAPDDQGRVDVSKHYDMINELTGGGIDKKQFPKIYAQNTGDKTLLLAEDKDGKPTQVTRNGSPVILNNQLLQKFAMFGDGNKDGKYSMKTMRGGQDAEGNVLPDVGYIVNERTGEIQQIGQNAQGAKPKMSDEEALKKLSEMTRQQPTGQGLGNAAPKESPIVDMATFEAMPPQDRRAYLESLTPEQQKAFMEAQQKKYAKKPISSGIKQGLGAVGSGAARVGNAMLEGYLGN